MEPNALLRQSPALLQEAPRCRRGGGDARERARHRLLAVAEMVLRLARVAIASVLRAGAPRECGSPHVCRSHFVAPTFSACFAERRGGDARWCSNRDCATRSLGPAFRAPPGVPRLRAASCRQR